MHEWYEKAPESTASPLSLVTETSTTPAVAAAGKVAVRVVWSSTVTSVAATPPTETVGAPAVSHSKPSPVMMTGTGTLTGARERLSAVMSGAQAPSPPQAVSSQSMMMLQSLSTPSSQTSGADGEVVSVASSQSSARAA